MYGVSPLVPAYGRTYASLRAAQADLDAGRDFRCPDGRYIALPELQQLNLRQVQVRYGRGLTKTGMLQVRPKAAEVRA